MTETSTPNAAQIESWNTRSGLRWAAFQAQLDAMLGPLTATVLAAASPRRDERVLDIGCGCGATLLALAEAVGAGGQVLGVDVSAPMLAIAERRLRNSGLRQVRIVRADAASHPFAPGGTDLVFSRFGVMFFDDPVSAFRALRNALRPGGRLAFACWQPLAVNDWMGLPAAAVRPLVGAQPPDEPDAPGPFAFARADRVRAILDAAGFVNAAIRPEAIQLRLGGAHELAAATDFAAQVGPAAAMLATATDPGVAARGRAAIAACLASHAKADGIVLDGAIWIVTAQAA